MLDLVRSQIAEVLGYAGGARVRADQAFKDLGFESLTAVELRDSLNTATGLNLPSTLVFDHPTPAELAGHVAALLFPDLAADATDVAGDDEARLRDVLTSIPISRFRKAGLLEMVLRLAEPPDEVPAPPPEATQATAVTAATESIDEMDAESLLRLATGDRTD